MFMTRSQRARAQIEALETWRAAAHVASIKWHAFLGAGADVRRFAFASYVAALDREEAAAADLATLSY